MSAIPDDSKTVIVTGASSGLGLGVAKAFLERGANVVVNARNEDRLRTIAEDLGDPDRIVVVPGDVGLKETGEKLVDTAVKRFGRLDVLVNNAGHFYPKPYTDYTEEDLEGFLSAHLKGAYFASQAATHSGSTLPLKLYSSMKIASETEPLTEPSPLQSPRMISSERRRNG